MPKTSYIPLGRLVSEVREITTTTKDEGLPYVGLEHIDSGSLTIARSAAADTSVSANNKFEVGDILFGKLRPALRKCVQATFSGYCSTDILVLRPLKDIDSRFVAWAMTSEYVFSVATRDSEGTRMPRASWQRLSQLPIFVPARPEQRRIADVLDAVDERIDTQRQIIRKLSNTRDGVTRAAFFGSGDLGSPVKSELGSFLLGIEAGISPDLEDTPAASDEWGVLKVSSMKSREFASNENKVIRDPSLINPRLEVYDGDLLLSRANTADLVGIACIARDPRPRLLLSDKSLRLKVNKKVALPEFIELALTLHEVRVQIQARATGTSGSMKNISQDDVRSITLPVSDVEGQAKIIRSVGVADKKIESERALLDKLKLLKAGLMEDLLTSRVLVTRGGELAG